MVLLFLLFINKNRNPVFPYENELNLIFKQLLIPIMAL
jgi:hypothetical protein